MYKKIDYKKLLDISCLIIHFIALNTDNHLSYTLNGFRPNNINQK